MADILPSKSIYFNDVNLLPRRGVVESRKSVPNELWRVIVSPMVTIVGETFTRKAAQLGLSITTPRFISVDQKISLYNVFESNKVNDEQKCFISVSLSEDRNSVEKLSHESVCKNYLFDCANGYIPQLKRVVQEFYDEIEIDNLMVGNVVTRDGVLNLRRDVEEYCNSLYIRVGIGNGSPCSSSDVAGINRGQITELIECSAVSDLLKMGYCMGPDCTKPSSLISDGGIKNSGYAIKAFAAGADYVIMGGYFARSLDAETHLHGDGTYFGCASEKQNTLAGLDKHSEGKNLLIERSELKSTEKLVSDLWGGLSSGVSYTGYKSLTELIGNGIFEIKQNSLPPKSRS
jgi:GMP reductase